MGKISPVVPGFSAVWVAPLPLWQKQLFPSFSNSISFYEYDTFYLYRITITGFHVSCPRRFWSESGDLKVLDDSPTRGGIFPISWLELLMCRQERRKAFPIYSRGSIVSQQKIVG